ncbi:hypothetical protein [Streptomyces sp. NBC_01538]|uniref:hypothetical protein n=1 Tax=Streptomyces sp. NBC_01538 TaxID=2903897 RepID=UPI00386F7968
MDPFAVVPQRLAELLRPQLDAIADEVQREVQLQVPEYARPADDAYVRTIRAGVTQALTLFVDRVADTGQNRDREHVVHTYQEIGRGESGEGRGLAALRGPRPVAHAARCPAR